MHHPNLKTTWHDFRAANPHVRIRDAATQLGVSEAELVATGCGETCTQLLPEWKVLLNRLPTLGTVMALTRSDMLVHEISGHFTAPHFHGDTALFFRPGLDTRYFLDKWAFAFAVNENGRHSLQCFDQYGNAAHKIYLKEGSDMTAYQQLVADLRTPQQRQHIHVERPPAAAPLPVHDDSLDLAALRAAWAAIRDVHEGNRIIRSLGGNRRAIYRALGEEYAQLLPSSTVASLLTTLAERQIPFILFGMNEAAVQSYSGTIHKLLTTGPWFNVLDPDFNLHLRVGGLGEVWRIRKPSDDGWVTALDVFDQHGNEIAVLSDRRGRGEQESPQWTEMVLALPTL